MVKRGTELFLSRKGQISLFIIAGVIILIGFGLFFYVRSQSVKSTLPPVPVLEEIPLQLNPVREYTQSCIESLAKEALVKVGSQGGYIDLERVGIITSAILPTEADGIKFSPEGDLNIPYWWYLKADNDCAKNCIFSSQQPDLQRASGGASDKSIESQVDIYIEENLEACLQNYQPLEDQGFVITEQGNAIVVTLIGEEEIIIFVEYPIEASLGDTTAELKQYFSVIPLDLKKIYALANEIKLAEINYNFLERHTLNLITSFASLNPDGLPPKSESTFEFGTGKTWNTFDVQQKIEQMLMTYIPALQVPFTRDYQKRIFPGDKIKTNVYANEIPANFDNIYPDLGVRFDYLGWWPIYFNAGQGGLIRSESITAPGLPIGYQRYATTYDISFPTLITITDPDAFGGEGYTFMFALEGNLRNNKPLDESFDGGEGIHFFQPSLACNPNQRNSGNVTILTRDHNNNPVDVNIAYTCGTETCSIGETENGELTAKFPVCTNGIVSYLAQDYFASVDILSTKLKEDIDLAVVEVFPFIEKKIAIRKLILANNLLGTVVNLDQNEKASIVLTRIKETPVDQDVVAIAEITQNQTTLSTLRLVPGKYEVRIDLIKQEPLLIPAEERALDLGILGAIIGVKENLAIPEIRLDDAYLTGGARLSEETGIISITASQLYSDTTLQFSAIGLPTPKSIEDLQQMSKIKQYSSQFREQLNPLYTR